jgi:copper resistance protein D
LSDQLAWVRAIHYASMLELFGIFAFLRFVAEPAFAEGGCRVSSTDDTLRGILLRLAWISLAVALASGALWLALVAADMSGRPFDRVLTDGLASVVLARTRFGHLWELRLALTAIIAGSLPSFARPGPRRIVLRSVALLVSAADLAALAWAGHARDNTGFAGAVHLSADVVHLLAAGAWLGGLVPLAILFSLALRTSGPPLAPAGRAATLRFSKLGIVSVIALFLSGMVNAWYLVGNIPNLVSTEYGHLLMVKVGLFAAMVGIAAFNKFRLTPRPICRSPEGKIGPSLKHLRRNSLTEAVLGLVLLVIVGKLGLLMPAIDAIMKSMP